MPNGIDNPAEGNQHPPDMMKLVALDAGTLSLPESEWTALEAFGELTRHEKSSPEEVIARADGAGIILTNKVVLDAKLLGQLQPALRLVCILATGMNNVDLVAARELGIEVRNVPAYSTASVAQHTLALLLELTNRVGTYARSVEEGEWKRSQQFCYWHHDIPELSGKTAGIVGFGQIGRATAALFNALGMRVVAHTRTEKDPPPYPGFAFLSREEVFACSDVVSLHCPLTEENAGFVDASLLAQMKPSAFLINTARGPLIKEADLYEALASGQLAGAALDVLSSEPMAEACPLADLPNCLITPHQAWATLEARQRLMAITVENIATFLAGT
jgi:glycerate dehydrogenase